MVIAMKRVMRLVSIQLWAVLGDMLSIGKNRKKKPKALYAGIIAFIVFMSGLSFFYNMMLGVGLRMYDALDLLPSMIMVVTCLVILMTTIFKVKGTIFGFKDYDMVMSLPVSTGVIVASRLIILYALNFMFVIIMVVPMMLAYGLLAEPDVMFYILGCIAMLFIPLVPIVIASVFGTLIAYAASKFRHSNVLNIIFSMGLLAGIVAASFSLNGGQKELVNIGKTLTKQLDSIYPLAGMYSDAVIHADYMQFLLFLGISALAFFLYTVIVKRGFKKMNTLMMTGSYRANFKLGQLKTSSLLGALYKKELKRYFSSTLYVLNTGFGIVMLTVAAIALIFVDLDKIFGSAEAASAITTSIPLYISFCVVMSSTTAPSLSLEGKSLWIIKSMPVTPRAVFLSKIAVNLTIISPAVLDIIIIGIAMKIDIIQIFLILLTLIACSVFVAFYGLLINLLLPNFNWTSEVVIIKQSAATMVTIFSSLGYVGIQALFLFLIPSMTVAYLCFILLTVVIDVVLYAILTTYGNRRYYALGN
jgi:ABC-2 type transport system permease protein